MADATVLHDPRPFNERTAALHRFVMQAACGGLSKRLAQAPKYVSRVHRAAGLQAPAAIGACGAVTATASRPTRQRGQKGASKGAAPAAGGKMSKKQANRLKAAQAQERAAARKAQRDAKVKAKQAKEAAAKEQRAAGGGGGKAAGQAAEAKEFDEPDETPVAFDKVHALLSSAGVAFNVTTHDAVRTSEEAAAVRGVPLASGAKAMVMRPKGGSLSMLVISAGVSLDMKKAAKVLGVPRKKLRMATPKDVHEATGCVTGAVPPFGSVFSIPTFVDNSLQEQGSTINFNAGLRTKSVSMTVADYMQVEHPTVASLSS